MNISKLFLNSYDYSDSKYREIDEFLSSDTFMKVFSNIKSKNKINNNDYNILHKILDNFTEKRYFINNTFLHHILDLFLFVEFTNFDEYTMNSDTTINTYSENTHEHIHNLLDKFLSNKFLLNKFLLNNFLPTDIQRFNFKISSNRLHKLLENYLLLDEHNDPGYSFGYKIDMMYEKVFTNLFDS